MRAWPALTGRTRARSFAIVLWECTARQVPYAGLDGIQARAPPVFPLASPCGHLVSHAFSCTLPTIGDSSRVHVRPLVLGLQ